MNVHIKTCGCGNQWKPMSRLDTRCWKCLRKDAESLMEARKGELMPVGALVHSGDRIAMGKESRPPPLLVPVRQDSVFSSVVMDAYKSAHEALVIPPPPSTHEEAVAMMDAGWHLNLMAPGNHMVAFEHRKKDGEHQVRPAGGTWEKYNKGRFAEKALGAGRFVAARPKD